jgi:hypothetical protein
VQLIRPRFHFSSTPGRKFSTRTSLSAASRSRRSRPGSVRTSRVIVCLVARNHLPPQPMSVDRVAVRPGRVARGQFHLDTSAPKSPSSMAVIGRRTPWQVENLDPAERADAVGCPFWAVTKPPPPSQPIGQVAGSMFQSAMKGSKCPSCRRRWRRVITLVKSVVRWQNRVTRRDFVRQVTWRSVLAGLQLNRLSTGRAVG